MSLAPSVNGKNENVPVRTSLVRATASGMKTPVPAEADGVNTIGTGTAPEPSVIANGDESPIAGPEAGPVRVNVVTTGPPPGSPLTRYETVPLASSTAPSAEMVTESPASSEVGVYANIAIR